MSDFVWLQDVRSEELAGRHRAALDVLFDSVDDLLVQNAFGEVDRLLASVDPSEWSTRLLVGFLSITLRAKDKLANRPAFVRSVRSVLEHREPPYRVTSLLSGLE